MTADLVRWLTIVSATFNVGVLTALYGRLGRLVLPRFAMSVLVASNMVLCIGMAWQAFELLHRPLLFSRIPITLALLAETAALVLLFHWYGTDEGRAHMKRMRQDANR